MLIAYIHEYNTIEVSHVDLSTGVVSDTLTGIYVIRHVDHRNLNLRYFCCCWIKAKNPDKMCYHLSHEQIVHETTAEKIMGEITQYF